MKTCLALLSLLGILFQSSAQNIAISTDDTLPDSSAILDVKSTAKGMLIPRMTEAQKLAIGTPANGLIIFQTDKNSGFYYNVGTPAVPYWRVISGDNDGTTSAKKVSTNVWHHEVINYGVSGVTAVLYDGEVIWYTTGGYLYKINKQSGETLQLLISVGTITNMMYDGRFIWLAGGGIYKIDIALKSIVGIYNIPVPKVICSDGTKIWVASNNGFLYSIQNNIISNAGAIGSNAVAMIFDGTYLNILYGGSSIIRYLNGSPVSSFPTSPGGSFGMVYDGTNFWVSNNGSNSISRINGITGITETYPMSFSPREILFDGSHIWVNGIIGGPPGGGILAKITLSGNIIQTFAPGGTNFLVFDETYIWSNYNFLLGKRLK